MAEEVAIVAPEIVAEATSNFFAGNSVVKEVVAEEKPVVEDKPIVEEKIEEKPIIAEEKPAVEGKPIVELVAEVKPKYKNEESEKVALLLAEGKIDDVREILNEQKRLSEVATLKPADAIKLNLQYQHKDDTLTEIQDRFNELYEMPVEPVQKLTETDDEFEERTAQYKKEVEKIEKRIARDAKPAVAELLKLQKEISLPNTVKATAEVKQPTQEELDAADAKAKLFIQDINKTLGDFKGYEATFKDEEVEIKAAYVPTNEEKTELQPLLALAGSNAGEFLTKIGWLDSKGELNLSKIAEDLPLVLDKTKVLQKIASETGEKRHAASVKAIKNIDYSGGKGKGGSDLGKTPQQLEGDMVNHFFKM